MSKFLLLPLFLASTCLAFTLEAKPIEKPAIEIKITPELLKKAIIIDVREPDEFKESHFKNAVNIPLSELDKEISTLKAKKEPIVVYCRSGRRSGKALELLKKHGIKAVNGINQQNLEKTGK